MNRVLALGTFDILHPGHVRFLRAASSMGDHLTVAVNTDAFTAKFKRPPIFTLSERTEMLGALAVVDTVIVNEGGADAKPAILQSGATIVVHGDDWTGASYMAQLDVTRPWLESHGVEIRYVPYTAGISTTDIILRIADVAVREALESGAYVV